MASIAPGLDGFLAQRQMASQQDARGMQQIQGLLGIQQAMQEQQLMPLKVKQIEQSLAAAKRKEDMIAQIFGGGQPPSPGGLLGNSVNSASGAAPGGILGILSNPAQVAALKIAGIDLVDMFKHQTSPQEFKQGSTYRDRATGAERTIPKLPEGVTLNNGIAGVVPGFTESTSAITGAQERAKAGFDMVQVPVPGGGTQMMTRADAARVLSGGQAPQTSPQVAPMPQSAPQAQQDPLMSQGFTPQQAQTLRVMDAPGAPPMSMSIPASRPAGGIPASNVIGGMGVTRPKLADTLSPGQKAVDNAFAKEYQEFVAGGVQGDQLGNITKIQDSLKTLRSGEIQTGPMYAAMPDLALAATNPKLAALKGDIADVVQRGLRPILGAQFTEKEGELLIKRAFDPALSAGVNAYRLESLDKKMRIALEAKQDAVKYFEENGTLAGFKGKIYTVNDFRNMKFDVPSSRQISLEDGSKVLAKFDEKVGKYMVTRGGKKFYVEED